MSDPRPPVPAPSLEEIARHHEWMADAAEEAALAGFEADTAFHRAAASVLRAWDAVLRTMPEGHLPSIPYFVALHDWAQRLRSLPSTPPGAAPAEEKNDD